MQARAFLSFKVFPIEPQQPPGMSGDRFSSGGNTAALPDLSYNAAGITRRDTDVKKRLTIGRAREWMIALVVTCIALLVLIGVATWWVA
jgi:hypothetical protein